MSRRTLSAPPTDDRASEFGRVLKDLRDAPHRRQSQLELAQALGRSTSFVSLLENGFRQPTLELISDLARTLRLSPDEESRLLVAAGFPSDPLGAAVRKLADVITAVGQVDELERTLVDQDLEAVARAWLDVFRGGESLRQGQLADANAYFTSVQARSILTPALRAYGSLLQTDALIPLGQFDRTSAILAEIFPDSNDALPESPPPGATATAAPAEGTSPGSAAADESATVGQTESELAPQSTATPQSAAATSGAAAATAGAPQWMTALPPELVPIFRAEFKAKEGNVALRRGDLTTAQWDFEASKTEYLDLLLDSSRNVGLTSEGLGWSEKRLAQMALFRGEPREALRHCASGQAYLNQAPNSRRQREGLRRLKDLEAWAHNALGDFKTAITLHTEALHLAEADGDVRGVMQSWLYLGDDYLGRINQWIASLSYGQPSQSLARHALFGYGTTEPTVAQWIQDARNAYHEAITRCERMGEQLLYGRALRNMGVILSYVPDFVAARSHLERAERTEVKYKQRRRLFGVYEAMAELDRDQRQPERAAHRYKAALTIIGELRQEEREAQRRRTSGALDVGARSLAGITGAASAPDPSIVAADERIRRKLDSLPDDAHEDAGTERIKTRWHLLYERIASLVRNAIRTSNAAPYAFDDHGERWIQELARMEQLPGPRLLAQNDLSVALETELPGGYSRSDLARQAHTARRTEIEQANGDTQQRHDLCCRLTILAQLNVPDTARAIREQIGTALTHLSAPSSNYLLDASPLPLPLAFVIKGSTVWIELPPVEVQALRAATADGQPEGAPRDDNGEVLGSWCYCLDDEVGAPLATDLRDIFEQLVALSREGTQNHPTREWLEQLVAPPSSTSHRPGF